MNKLKKIFLNMASVKSADDFIDTANKSELKKTLGIFDLIILGIGAVVGTGIFTIVGVAAKGGPEAVGAGPALIISMVLAAVACIFTALCYSEFASMIPVAGSAYTYTYATMGEFMAWIVGWILMLEYAIGNITVASAWTGYLFQLLKGFEHVLPSWLVNPPMWLINDYRTVTILCKDQGLNIKEQIPYLFDTIPIAINVPAIFIVTLLTILLVKGVRESTRLASIMVGLNLCIILSFVVFGAFYVKPENWAPFAPNGIEGILSGAFIIFFAYIGFDAISTAAEETKTAEKKKKTSKQSEIDALKSEIETLKAEAKEKDDKYLRLAAEYDNFRRRSREEKDATYSSAMADTVSELLPIIDNLERAAAFDDGEKVREGLKMIASTVSASLSKLGVEAFGEPGDKFDPNLHNAVMHDEDDSERENEITDVFQKGYKKGNKIIRFAMVKTVN